MRLLCVGCGHTEAVRDVIFRSPDEWMVCPNCGPLDHITDPGRGESRKAQARNFAKGGVLIRGKPRTIC